MEKGTSFSYFRVAAMPSILRWRFHRLRGSGAPKGVGCEHSWRKGDLNRIPTNLKDYFMQTSRKDRIPYILCSQSNSFYNQHDQSCKPRTEQQ